MNLNRIALFLFGIQLGITTVFGTPYQCEKCGFTTEDPGRRLVHIAVEHGYWCCFEHKKRYKSAAKFRDHIAHKHNHFVCTECNLRVFKKDKDKEYQQHFQKYHSKTQSSNEDESRQCPYCFEQLGKQIMLSNKWEQRVHCWHRHGTLKDFLPAVLPLYQCCKLYHEKIIDCIAGNSEGKNSEGDILENIKCFSKHIYEGQEHKNLCLLCEQEISSFPGTLWFQQENFVPEFIFKQARRGSFLSENRETNIMCPACRQPLPSNAESKLFQLRIDLLPFGRGLDAVTHPYACITDGTADTLSTLTTEISEKMLCQKELKSFATDKDTEGKFPTKPNSESPQSPSFSTKSVETTFASTDDKKHKKLFVSDSNAVPLAGNGTNGDVFENL